jgi:hypothetical protein
MNLSLKNKKKTQPVIVIFRALLNKRDQSANFCDTLQILLVAYPSRNDAVRIKGGEARSW